MSIIEVTLTGRLTCEVDPQVNTIRVSGAFVCNASLSLGMLDFSAGTVQASGVMTVVNRLYWNGGSFRPGTTVVTGPLSTNSLLSDSTKSCTGQLTLAGATTWSRGNLDVSGGTVVNTGTMTLDALAAVSVVAGSAPGSFVNSGTFIKSNTSALNFAGAPFPATFQNTGTLSLRSGATTVAASANYIGTSGTFTGGVWSLENAATLAITSADIRSIGAGTTVSLLSTSSASFPALANLTTNSGTLVLGPGRTQNINPVGGTFTNSGELSLRAGSLFNVVGNFIQTAIGTLRTQIGGPLASQIGRLTATGSVTLGGTVITEYANGYTPASCNATLPFISAPSLIGTFANVAPAPVNGRVSRVVVGASLAALSVRNPADVATIGGLPPGDNALTADDVIAYLNSFFSNNLAIADIASLGGALSPDGQLTPDDLVAFLNSFFAGCN